MFFLYFFVHVYTFFSLISIMVLSHITLLKKLEVNYLVYSHISAKLLRMALKPEFKPDLTKKHKSVINIYKFKNGIKDDLVHPLTIGEPPKEDEHDILREPVKAKSSN
ncbi:unnamed protein product [Callosobruchus maculatus]|uniref:Uncharacterized protein n=1 Tax=Callosobruchus maculatus TaxID=64391 RepID=A0A653BKF1_CALMS|nr:unnamed protein product [Callosobruchus maculatus]